MKLSKEQKALVAEYGHLFSNTGGNDIVELIEREGVNYFNNMIVAELQGCCYSQVILLQQLKKAGLLVHADRAESESTVKVSDRASATLQASVKELEAENARLVAGGQDGFPPVEVDWDSGEVRDVSDNEVG